MTHQDQTIEQPINTAMITMLEACGFQVLRAPAGDHHLVKGTIESAAAFYKLTVAGVDAEHAAQRPEPVVKQESLLKLQHGNEESHEGYDLRTIPAGCLVLVMSVEIQGNRLTYKILGFGRNKKHWVIDYNIIDGDPAKEDVWTRLTALRERPLVNSFGVPMRVQTCAIDSGGHHTDEVYHYAKLYRQAGVFAVKGTSSPVAPVICRPVPLDFGKGSVQLWFVGTNTAKSLLFNYIDSDKKSVLENRFIKFPAGLPDHYFEQLSAEVFDPEHSQYRKLPGRRNEAIDLFVYCFAAAFHPLLRLHAMHDADWTLLEDLLEPTNAGSMPTVVGNAPIGRTMLEVGSLLIEANGETSTELRWPCRLLGRGKYKLYVENAQAELHRTHARYLAELEAGDMSLERFSGKMDALDAANPGPLERLMTAQGGKSSTP